MSMIAMVNETSHRRESEADEPTLKTVTEKRYTFSGDESNYRNFKVDEKFKWADDFIEEHYGTVGFRKK